MRIIRPIALVAIALYIVLGPGALIFMSANIESLSWQVEMLQSQVDELRSQSTDSGLDSGPKTEEAEEPQSPVDNFQAKLDELLQMPFETCEGVDPYEYLGVGELTYYGEHRDPVLDNGATFDVDCATGRWGWWIERPEGRSVDTWKLSPPENFNRGENKFGPATSVIPMIPGEYGTPVSAVHPLSEDAVTFGEIEVGGLICWHPEAQRQGVTLEVLGIYIERWLDETYTVTLEVSDKSDNQYVGPLDALDVGLLPSEGGRWLQDYSTNGSCGSGLVV